MKYSDLKVWQKAIDVVVNVYAVGKLLPKDERFGIVSQMQRAAVISGLKDSLSQRRRVAA